MIFTETPLDGAFVIDLEPKPDQRGFFARAWCQDEVEKQGLLARIVQCNLSFNEKAGTLRGMHYQLPLIKRSKWFAAHEERSGM